MVENVGELIGLDGRTAVPNNTFFNIDHPQPGELRISNTVGLQNSLSHNEQGIYTCQIPLQSGEIKEINFGLYPSEFNSKYHSYKLATLVKSGMNVLFT